MRKNEKPQRTQRTQIKGRKDLMQSSSAFRPLCSMCPLWLLCFSSSKARAQSASNFLIHSSSTEGSNSGFGSHRHALEVAPRRHCGHDTDANHKIAKVLARVPFLSKTTEQLLKCRENLWLPDVL
jgi:hypothetical protein